MMGSNGQTIVKYQDTALPVTGTPVTLFNSATAFASVQSPSGGSFHLLGLQWFQFSISFATAAGAEAGTVTGAFSDDKGLTWVTFYTKAVNSGLGPAVALNEDEVYVGMYQDIRFQFTQSTNADTIFRPHLALNPHKASSTRDATTALTGALV